MTRRQDSVSSSSDEKIVISEDIFRLLDAGTKMSALILARQGRLEIAPAPAPGVQ